MNSQKWVDKMLNESTQNIETLLYGRKIDEPEYMEQILSSNPANFDKIKELATKDGFSHFRISKVNLSENPWTKKSIKRMVNESIDPLAAIILTHTKLANNTPKDKDHVFLASNAANIIKGAHDKISPEHLNVILKDNYLETRSKRSDALENLAKNILKIH